ncbi:MAG: hypothetical protein COV74_06470 [Candidatus Omnitrophica bacterium CG11_big_fil_rev_8_21_14_0_20_45_26]|uniref:Uncharacterized protein n=1 Tax=Candidatus Abzuiibacterium crystallinum TaxID=1974748 RepID=A0A2H0LNQ1_9BACT|nr:MAG: hypothetical protein COV74_06470 [Candidatus Omnitrophica bacterium CG11_big_fil_rev_8_21_14_0_20_45_26]
MGAEDRSGEPGKGDRETKLFRGRLLWFNPNTRCGCIVRADGKGDCYIDPNAFFESLQFLREGEEVQFEIDARTHKAINLKAVKRQNLGCCS